MLCEKCQKQNATSIFLSPETNKIIYLCGACYRKTNNDIELEKFAIKETVEINHEQVCTNCGTSYAEFIKTSSFGCEKCYEAFKDYVEKNIINLFDERQYLGKKPNAYYVQKQIKELEQMVEICLKNGNLQKATKYGLEIKKLKEDNYARL